MSAAAIYHPSRQPTLSVSHTLGWFVSLSLLLHVVLLWSVMQGRESIPAPAAQPGTTGLKVHLQQRPPSPPHESLHAPSQPAQRTASPRPENNTTEKAVLATVREEAESAPIAAKEEPQTAASEASVSVTENSDTSSLQEQLNVTLQQALARHFTYPLLARRRGWQGEVLLAFRLEADGRISNARVARSSGYGVLDHAALSALAKVGRIKPGTLRGFAMQLPVIYRLEG